MDILEKIVEQKKREVEMSKKILPLERMQAFLKVAKPKRHGSLVRRMEKGFCVIAEVKKGSPSKGIIRKDFDPLLTARQYLRAGADAISVITDEKFFFGRLEYLSRISTFSTVPLLRKDFIIDEYQIYEARAAGADIILLIAKLLSSKEMARFLGIAKELGMEAICEVHDKKEIAKALKAGAKIIGVNNRNLRTFQTDLEVSLELRRHIPEKVFAISESGIVSPEDVIRLKRVGFDAILVGESLMRQKSPTRLLKSLRNRKEKA